MLGPRRGLFWWLVVSIAAMAIGAFGPWARVFGLVDVGGLNGDGWFVLVAAIVSGVLLFLHHRSGSAAGWPLVGVVVAGVISVAVATIDIVELVGTQGLSGADDTDDLVSPGWGIWMACIASVSVTIAAAIRFVITGDREAALG
jgi:hypothetical protein